MLPDHGRQGQGASLPGPRSWITEGKPRQAMPARLGCRLMLPGAGQAAARLPKKFQKKIKTGLAFTGNHAIFSLFVQQGKQGFYLMRDYRTRRNRGTREPPKENFFCFGV